MRFFFSSSYGFFLSLLTLITNGKKNILLFSLFFSSQWLYFYYFYFYVVSFILYDHNTKAPGIRSFTYNRRVWVRHRRPCRGNRRLPDIVASFSRLRFPLSPLPSHRRGILLTAFVMKKKKKITHEKRSLFNSSTRISCFPSF